MDKTKDYTGNKGFPMNFDVSTLKEGDVFSDGFKQHDLEFVSADEDSVFALNDGHMVELDKISVQMNGMALPREIEDTYAVGLPGERRAEKLVLVKTIYHKIQPDDLYVYYRKDRDLPHYILERFSEHTINAGEREEFEKTGFLNTYLYIVKDKEFVKKEIERQNALIYANTKRRYSNYVIEAKHEYDKAWKAFKTLVQPEVDKCIENRDVEGLEKLASECPDCPYQMSLYRTIDMVKKAIEDEA